MAHTIKFLDKIGVVVLRCYGDVKFPEIRDVLNELVMLPGFKSGLKLVADFQQCDTLLTGAEVRALAEYAKRTDVLWGETKWIILASKDVIYGLARMYTSLTSDYNVTTNVFRNSKEADDWFALGTDLSQILDMARE